MRRLLLILVCLAAFSAAQGSEVVRPPNIIWVANEAATGTTVNKLVKLTGAPSTAIVTTAGDTSGAVGVCVSGCGLAAASARASIAAWGNVSCVFDAAVTAGNYIGISAAVAGNCADTGATYPTTGQVLGRVLATGAAGTHPVVLFSAGLKSPAGTVTGTGTTNTLPKYTTGASGIIGDSAVTDDGSAVTVTNRTLSATIAGGNVPVWEKYALVAIANGVNTCANANGCWQVNGVYNSIRAAGLTQSVVLGPLGTKGNVTDYRIKTAVICTGAATAVTGLGTTGTINLFRVENYDLNAAVADGNMVTGPPTGGGNDTAAATNLVASLITTVNNVDQMAAACAVDYWVGRVVLP